MLTIRVYGRPLPDLALRDALQAKLGPVSLVPGDYHHDDPTAPDLVRGDLLLCAVDDANSDPAQRFIARFISHHGGWSYLPILVVGLPADVKEQQALFRLGATRYLPAGMGDVYVAEHARKVIGHTWWHVESRSTLPAFLVDRCGTIIRANEAAVKRFGPGLVGSPYLHEVEKRRAPWSDEHPIAQALCGDGHVVGADRKFRRDDGGEERYFLHCRPMHGSRRRPQFAAVLVLEMSRWEKLVAAPGQLAQATSPADLYERIVRLGEDLGFGRVRLYEVVDRDKYFKGRASTGYDLERARWFVEEWQFEIAGDEPSRDTVQARIPRLWIHRATKADMESGAADTDIKRYFDGSPNFAEKLAKEGVRRWIEAPIWLPIASAGRPPRLWGKLSIDQGPGSDQLDERDIGDVAMYCRLVSEAITAFSRRETQRTVERTVQDISGSLVADVETADLLPRIIKPVLALCQQLTGADVVLYRRYDKESPTPLRLVGDPVFSLPELSDRFTVPRDIDQGEKIGELFRFVDPKNPLDRPYIVEDAPRKVKQLWGDPGEPLQPTEMAYLEGIQSELHVPLCIGEKVVGVIIAVSQTENAFPPQALDLTERLSPLVSVWVELARRHDGQLWVESVLENAAEVLPLLVHSDGEEAFFAGLSALLSAHTGLHWNRVFIYSCVGKAPGIAQLVYALGGLAGKDNQKRHRDLHRGVTEDRQLATLKDLVEHRQANPEPHYIAPDGRVVRDELYDLCVDRPRREEKPLTELFSPDQPMDSAADPPASDGPDDCAVRYVLSRDYRKALDIPIPFVFNRDVPSKWVLEMNGKVGCKDMFALDKTIYAFPLSCAYHRTRQPLGVVLVDMQHHNDLQINDMCAATRSILSLASDIYALRVLQRRVRGKHKLLHDVFHERTLTVVWSAFQGRVRDLVGNLDPATTAASPDGMKVLARAVADRLVNNPDLLGELLDDAVELGNKIKNLEDTSIKPIMDLGGHLHSLCEDYRKLARPSLELLDDHCEDVKGVSLPCDEVVLHDAVYALLENSIDAARRKEEKVKVVLEALAYRCPQRGFFRDIVEIHVTDNGPGIDRVDRPHIFLDGYTTSGDPNKGHGLSTIKAQLNAFHGDLELLPDDDKPGARFVIRFGIPNDFPRQFQGVPRVQTVAP
jgi:signal transduction histidine kinase